MEDDRGQTSWLIREKTVLYLEADVFGPAIPQHSDGQSRNFAILEEVSMDCMVEWLFDVSDNGGQLGILIGVYVTPKARKASVARPIEDHFGTRLVSQFQILPSSSHTSKTACRSKGSAETKETNAT